MFLTPTVAGLAAGLTSAAPARTMLQPRERGELVPPGVPAFGEAVQEYDERALALLRDVQPDAVHFDRTVLNHAARLLPAL